MLVANGGLEQHTSWGKLPRPRLANGQALWQPRMPIFEPQLDRLCLLKRDHHSILSFIAQICRGSQCEKCIQNVS
jgi:hypothetical protein